jgi:hypothetical protein
MFRTQFRVIRLLNEIMLIAYTGRVNVYIGYIVAQTKLDTVIHDNIGIAYIIHAPLINSKPLKHPM